MKLQVGKYINEKSIQVNTHTEFRAKYRKNLIHIERIGAGKFDHLTRYRIKVGASERSFRVVIVEDFHCMKDAVIKGLKEAKLL